MSLSSFTARSPLALVGAGKMGGALLAGWLERGLAAGQRDRERLLGPRVERLDDALRELGRDVVDDDHLSVHDALTDGARYREGTRVSAASTACSYTRS